ncbi:MAG TPA: hypothetical protein VMD97_02055 [Candidatus Aquilonibacter sp.]|nr:hypothetical protein [Candidatus Aquilonibacter sp.]
MHLDHKRRWVFGPVIDGMPVAMDYASSGEWPMIVDGYALTFCVMNAHQLRAARKDTRLTVLPSLHAGVAIPDSLADHHARYGLKRGMSLHDALCALAVHHHAFEPED